MRTRKERIFTMIVFIRMLVTLAANVCAVFVADAWFDGFTLGGRGIGAALVIGVFGAVVTPLVVRFAFPVVVYSLGLVSIALNMIAVYLAAA